VVLVNGANGSKNPQLNASEKSLTRFPFEIFCNGIFLLQASHPDQNLVLIFAPDYAIFLAFNQPAGHFQKNFSMFPVKASFNNY